MKSLILSITLLVFFVPTMAVAKPKIVCIGDSVTLGRGVAPENSFCGLLGKSLTKYTVINAGIGGNTSSQGLARFQADVISKNPFAVIIMFGLNDSYIDDGQSPPRVSVARYKQNLNTMLDQLQKKQIRAILMTSSPNTRGPLNAWMHDFIKGTRSIAAHRGITLVDNYQLFAEMQLEGVNLIQIFTDGTHPNEIGHTLIYQELRKEF